MHAHYKPTGGQYSASFPLNPLELDAASGSFNEQDTRLVLRSLLRPHVPPFRLELSMDVVARKSEGNFIYLNWLRKRLEADECTKKGPAGFLDIYRLPNGVAEQYLQRFQVAFPFGFKEGPNGGTVCRVFEAIVAAATPLHLRELEWLSGVSLHLLQPVLDSVSSLFTVREDSRPRSPYFLDRLARSKTAGRLTDPGGDAFRLM